MRASNIKSISLLVCVVVVTLVSGCTNWKKECQKKDVLLKNCEGRYQAELDEKSALSDRVLQGQQTIEELRRQMDELDKSPREVTGFEVGDVDVDAVRGTITVTLPNTILFTAGKATLKKSVSTELDHIRSVLQSKYGNKEVDVVGHTDSDPIKKSPWKDNWELSAQRALSVVRYLVKKGIDDERIRAVGCGESQPVAANTSASGKAKNRRVEIVVYMR